MKLHWPLQWNYGLACLIIFGIEVIIARFVHDGFIRPFLGDALVIGLIYTFVKTFFNTPPRPAILGVVAFAFTVEVAQYFQLAHYLGLADQRWAVIVLGATFDPLDLLAYVLGGLGCYGVERWYRYSFSNTI